MWLNPISIPYSNPRPTGDPIPVNDRPILPILLLSVSNVELASIYNTLSAYHSILPYRILILIPSPATTESTTSVPPSSTDSNPRSEAAIRALVSVYNGSIILECGQSPSRAGHVDRGQKIKPELHRFTTNHRVTIHTRPRLYWQNRDHVNPSARAGLMYSLRV